MFEMTLLALLVYEVRFKCVLPCTLLNNTNCGVCLGRTQMTCCNKFTIYFPSEYLVNDLEAWRKLRVILDIVASYSSFC